jgi:hypothetical protein
MEQGVCVDVCVCVPLSLLCLSSVSLSCFFLTQDHRLMAAPYEIGAEAPAAATCFNLEQLQVVRSMSETRYGKIERMPTNFHSTPLQAEGGSGPATRQLCEELRDNHFVIVSLGAPGRAAVQGVWAAARRFFELPSERKEAVAGRMRKAEGNVGVIGWGTMPDDNEVNPCWWQTRVHARVSAPAGCEAACYY